jgi:hypothetical protein
VILKCPAVGPHKYTLLILPSCVAVQVGPLEPSGYSIEAGESLREGHTALPDLEIAIVQHRALVLRSIQVIVAAALGRSPHWSPITLRPTTVASAAHHGSPPRWTPAAAGAPASGRSHGGSPHRHRRAPLWDGHCDERPQRPGTCGSNTPDVTAWHISGCSVEKVQTNTSNQTRPGSATVHAVPFDNIVDKTGICAANEQRVMLIGAVR